MSILDIYRKLPSGCPCPSSKRKRIRKKWFERWVRSQGSRRLPPDALFKYFYGSYAVRVFHGRSPLWDHINTHLQRRGIEVSGSIIDEIVEYKGTGD